MGFNYECKFDRFVDGVDFCREGELTRDFWLAGMMYCMRAQLRDMPGPGSIVCVSSVGFARWMKAIAQSADWALSRSKERMDSQSMQRIQPASTASWVSREANTKQIRQADK